MGQIMITIENKIKKTIHLNKHSHGATMTITHKKAAQTILGYVQFWEVGKTHLIWCFKIEFRPLMFLILNSIKLVSDLKNMWPWYGQQCDLNLNPLWLWHHSFFKLLAPTLSLEPAATALLNTMALMQLSSSQCRSFSLNIFKEITKKYTDSVFGVMLMFFSHFKHW